MSDEPPLLLEILSRLPVKTLLRCRSVSNDWRELIDSPDFVKIHLNQSKGTYNVLTFLRRYDSILSSHSLSLNSRPTFVKVEPPFNLTGFFPRDLGSCNGLICLSWGKSNQELSLWNPSTKKHKWIPTMPIHYPPHTENNRIVDTLRYDNANDDYKVVRLLQFSASKLGSCDYKVLVYSLKLNVWQNVEHDFPYCTQRVYCNAPMSHSVCVGGAIHWSLLRKDDLHQNHVLVAFDLASQSFRSVPQPHYTALYMSIDVGILGGCLCLVGIPEEDIDYVDIWMMKEYGVKESWMKLLTISDMSYYLSSVSMYNSILPTFRLFIGRAILHSIDLGYHELELFQAVNDQHISRSSAQQPLGSIHDHTKRTKARQHNS
uniref:F-box domain-containing protein n=1 Tax=Tanacetum cinerariifolium TaxID=118510 RepID=A0A6L2JBM7_TANCI|nr:hypothetical protein [Tanacetum cinerariifolium]